MIEFAHGWQTEVCKIVAEFLNVLFAQHLGFSAVWSSGHRGTKVYIFRDEGSAFNQATGPTSTTEQSSMDTEASRLKQIDFRHQG
jgi:hypothetical protein